MINEEEEFLLSRLSPQPSGQSSIVYLSVNVTLALDGSKSGIKNLPVSVTFYIDDMFCKKNITKYIL